MVQRSVTFVKLPDAYRIRSCSAPSRPGERSPVPQDGVLDALQLGEKTLGIGEERRVEGAGSSMAGPCISTSIGPLPRLVLRSHSIRSPAVLQQRLREDGTRDTIAPMKKLSSIILILILMGGLQSAWSDSSRRVIVTAEFSIPLNPPVIDDDAAPPPGAADTFSVGVGYRFWGIFYGSMHLYNEIIYGASNPIGVTVRPMGLFSGGMGLEIPLGGPNLIFDWQWLFTGPSAPNRSVMSYARQSKIGVSFSLTEAWRVHVFSRTIRSFSDQAQELAEYRVFLDDPNARFSTIGLGTSLRF